MKNDEDKEPTYHMPLIDEKGLLLGTECLDCGYRWLMLPCPPCANCGSYKHKVL